VRGRCPRLGRDASGDAVQPVSDGRSVRERVGLSDEYEEGSLERVLGVSSVTQRAAADRQDHGAVAPHERGEGDLVAAGEESVEQFTVGSGRSEFVAQHADEWYQ
jgi:hypothetical protein